MAAAFAERLGRLRRELSLRSLDAFLVSNLVNVRYLSGFESTASLVVVDPHRATLVTDGRYIESARKQLGGWEAVCLPRAEVSAWWKRFWCERGYKTLGFEGTAEWGQVEQWKRQARPTRLVEAGEGVRRLRLVKDGREVAHLRKAARLADDVMQRVFAFLRPGVTEHEVSRHIRRLVDEVGAEGESFPNIVASGPNSSRPHHHPGARRLRRGDFVILDLGVVWKGYCSDMTRTVALGDCDDERRRVYEACLRSQKAALAAVRPAALAREADAAARNLLANEGLGEYFVHGLGHGVGLEIHEAPSLHAQAADRLEIGMAVTVEPGVYLPGRFGVRIEDLVLVTPKGASRLSRTPKALLILER